MRTQAAEFGIHAENVTFDYNAAYKRSRQVSERLTKGVSFLMKKNNIAVIEGHGEIANPGKCWSGRLMEGHKPSPHGISF